MSPLRRAPGWGLVGRSHFLEAVSLVPLVIHHVCEISVMRPGLWNNLCFLILNLTTDSIKHNLNALKILLF